VSDASQEADGRCSVSRWRLAVRESSGRAIVTLLDGDKNAGVINVSLQDYESLCRTIMSAFTKTTSATLAKFMNDRLWADAQRACREDVEEAMRRLLEFGWTPEYLKKFVLEMTITLAGEILSVLPEKVT
jgi:hypothetical protein